MDEMLQEIEARLNEARVGDTVQQIMADILTLVLTKFNALEARVKVLEEEAETPVNHDID